MPPLLAIRLILTSARGPGGRGGASYEAAVQSLTRRVPPRPKPPGDDEVDDDDDDDETVEHAKKKSRNEGGAPPPRGPREVPPPPAHKPSARDSAAPVLPGHALTTRH
eukprot:scaffold3228_cov126-Isochrysis_galbana.AAC.1